MRKEVIYGCLDVPLMTRWILLEGRWGHLMVHCFHRGDEDREMHDHPWNFWTLILKNGYLEHSEEGYKRLRPGRIYRRRATWKHRVLLYGGENPTPSWSIVLTGPRIREWGFWTVAGEWIDSRLFLKEKRCQ